MIVIICAMSEERDAFLSLMDDVKVVKGKKLNYHGMQLDNKYFKGILNGQEVAIIHSGIGKVYAAIVTVQAIEKFKPELIINVGCAGSLNKNIHVGDVVVADRVADWDVDVPEKAWERSIYNDKISFACAGNFVKKASKIKDIKIGNIVSADEFIYKNSQVKTIKKYFPDALCGEMEGSSIACTCYAYGINCAIVRSISDETLVNSDYKNFEFNLNKACINAAKICAKILKDYK